MIARNHAELGWKPVLRKLLKLEIKHRNQPLTLRLHGHPVVIDPKVWNADMDIRINTGLGTGSRDRDVAMMQIVLNNQYTMADKLSAVGMVSQALNLLPYMSRAITALNEATGLRNPDHYMPAISEEEVQQLQQQLQQQKDAPTEVMKVETMKAQALTQIEQAKLQADQQKFAAEAQLKQQENAMQAQIEMEKMRAGMEADQLLENAKMQAQVIKNQAELEGDIATKQMERALQMEEMASKERIAFAEMGTRREIEMMKLGLMEDGITARPIPGMAVDSATLLTTLQELTEGLAHLRTAPRRVVRDPTTNQAIGVETAPRPGTSDKPSLRLIRRDPATNRVVGLEPEPSITNGSGKVQ